MRDLAEASVYDGYAVVLLQVKLWDGISIIDRGFSKISHGSRVDHVSDHVLLDSFVFWYTSGRVLATDESDVSSALLVASIISSLFGHDDPVSVC